MASIANLRLMGWVLVISVLSFAPAAALAQEESEEQPAVTLKEVKERLKRNREYLDEARKRGKAGDAAGVQTAIENYERGMQGLNRALDAGQFEGDVFQREAAFERVERATRKHGEVLANLLTRVPEQARPAIERAMQNSQKGRVTALENLQRVRAERRVHEAAQERHRMGQPGERGRPGTVGRPGGVGGGPGGAGGPGGTGRPGGGRPGGGPGPAR